MAGEWLLKKLQQRGGSDSDYSDIVYGTVTSTSPLKIQISNQMTLTDAFLNVSDSLTNQKLRVKIDGEEKTLEILNELKVGDGVSMIRHDGGQQFYVFEKNKGGDVDG
ncbi:DUF2577 domain-containing protein [Secundilactobacillus kimchicus]|uniref:DUF2577 domain-containing protein n=1 Tax=Secundilactobacillus kimchicus TaxID=528209 RepID=UPI001C031973|nr:DUF2577 domain-containing protein [Secundilactobacillus kimchicus]MBT9671749.1 DUF2577 domain-containing protein [Secundilactobacillus kimchicus]